MPLTFSAAEKSIIVKTNKQTKAQKTKYINHTIVWWDKNIGYGLATNLILKNICYNTC